MKWQRGSTWSLKTLIKNRKCWCKTLQSIKKSSSNPSQKLLRKKKYKPLRFLKANLKTIPPRKYLNCSNRINIKTNVLHPPNHKTNTSQNINPNINQNTNQNTSQNTNKNISQNMSKNTNQSMTRSTNQSTNQNINHDTIRSMNRSMK